VEVMQNAVKDWRKLKSCRNREIPAEGSVEHGQICSIIEWISPTHQEYAAKKARQVSKLAKESRHVGTTL
jgi:hypothetical protein